MAGFYAATATALCRRSVADYRAAAHIIHGYRHVPYVVADAELALALDARPAGDRGAH